MAALISVLIIRTFMASSSCHMLCDWASFTHDLQIFLKEKKRPDYTFQRFFFSSIVFSFFLFVSQRQFTVSSISTGQRDTGSPP